MKAKHFNKMVIVVTVGILLLIAGMTFVMDPLIQYYGPMFGLKPIIKNERYQNPGIARNFSYDTIILGDSMSENFRSSWFDQAFGGKTVKLTMSGAYSLDYLLLLNNVQLSKNEVRRIVWTMPVNSKPSNQHRFPLPDYLYDINLINDIKYLLNKDIIFQYIIQQYELNCSNQVPSLDEAYVWDDRYDVGKEIILKDYSERPKQSECTLDERVYLQRAKEHLTTLIPAIKHMKDTHFDIWIPPFSLMYWDEQIRGGKFKAEKALLEYGVQELLKQRNVSVHFFDDPKSLGIISDLNNYKDPTHYGTDINKYILQCIADETNVLTEENFEERFQNFWEYILSYDYDKLYQM